MVLFLSVHDWANVSVDFAASLESVGIPAMALTQIPLPIDYRKMARVYENKEQLKKACEMADVIIWMHSQYTELPIKNLKKKKLVVFHGGTQYRRYFLRHNKTFNPKVEITLTQTAELLNHGAKNEKWLLPAVDTKFIKPRYLSEGGGKIVIGHYPRGKDKGTAEINRVLSFFSKSGAFQKKFTYKFSKERVSWEDNLKRMNACDVYIESLSQGSTTRNKHDWSVTCLEAAALGKFVISNFNFNHLANYRKEYGECPLRVAISMKGLGRRLTRLLLLNRKQIRDIQHQMRQWVERQHSYEAIGERLKRLLEI